MNPELIYGQYGAIACLLIAVIHLYRENSALRAQSMELLKKYQDRDEEERKLRNDEARKRAEDERWRAEQGPRRSGEELRRSKDESNRTEGQR